jgi:hypothetical protein
LYYKKILKNAKKIAWLASAQIHSGNTVIKNFNLLRKKRWMCVTKLCEPAFYEKVALFS